MTNSPSKTGDTHTAARFEHDHLLSHRFGMNCELILPPTIQDQQPACSEHAFPISSKRVLSLPAFCNIGPPINKRK